MIELVTVDFDSIRGNREPSPDDDLSELVLSVKRDGLHRPVIVIESPDGGEDLSLFDGARRIAAMRQLGWTQANVRVVRKFQDLVPLIRTVRDTADLARPLVTRPPDFLSQYEALRPLGHYFLGQNRMAKIRGVSWRKPVLKAYGLGHDTIRDIRMLVRVRSETPPGSHPRLERILDAFYRGEITAHAARYRLESTTLRGGITKPQVQTETLDNAVASLRGTVGALSDLGALSNELGPEKVNQWRSDLLRLRKDLYRVYKNLGDLQNEQ